MLSLVILGVSGVTPAFIQSRDVRKQRRLNCIMYLCSRMTICFPVQVFAACRLLTGVGGMGCFMCAYVLGVEATVPAHTVLISVLLSLGFNVGALVFSAVIFIVRDWVTLQVRNNLGFLRMRTLPDSGCVSSSPVCGSRAGLPLSRSMVLVARVTSLASAEREGYGCRHRPPAGRG